MSYEKQTFTGGEVFTAAELSHIEAGVAANDAKATELITHASALASALDEVVGWKTYDQTQIGRKDTNNTLICMADSLQTGEKMHLKNLAVTKVGDMNGGSLHSMMIWGFYGDGITTQDKHDQIGFISAAQIEGGMDYTVTANSTYKKVVVYARAKVNGEGSDVDETFRIQFDYKIVPAETVESDGGSSVGTYSVHGFQDGNDLYPDELDDMEAQIAANEEAIAAAEARLEAAAIAAAELLPWKTFSQTFTGANAFACTMLKGQTLAISDISITLDSGEPTQFKVWGNTQQQYSADTVVQLASETSFEDFTVQIPSNFTYLRICAEPSTAQQTISFKYKLY